MKTFRANDTRRRYDLNRSLFFINFTAVCFALFNILNYSDAFSQERRLTDEGNNRNLRNLQIQDTVLLANPEFQHVATEYLEANPQLQQEVRQFQNEVRPIKVKEADGSTSLVNASLKNFKLQQNQNIGYIETSETYIDRSTIPADARVMNGVYVAKCAQPGAYGDQVQFQLVLLKAFPVEYNIDNGTWNGSIRMKCVQVGDYGGHPPTPIALQEPIVYNLTVNDKNFGDKQIREINQEVPADYMLHSTDNVEDEVKLGVRQMGEMESVDEEAPVIPFVSITTDRPSIQGYGIQTAKVKVKLVGSSKAGPITFSLNSDKGYLEPDEVTLSGADPSQTVTLRSEGTGATVVSANLTGFLTTSQRVNFGFPWSFIISAIIGGIIGTLIRIYGMRKEGFSWLSFIAGVLTGVIVAALYWAVGYNVLKLTIDINYLNEFAVICVSAVGGILGAVRLGKAVGAD